MGKLIHRVKDAPPRGNTRSQHMSNALLNAKVCTNLSGCPLTWSAKSEPRDVEVHHWPGELVLWDVDAVGHVTGKHPFHLPAQCMERAVLVDFKVRLTVRGQIGINQACRQQSCRRIHCCMEMGPICKLRFIEQRDMRIDRRGNHTCLVPCNVESKVDLV